MWIRKGLDALWPLYESKMWHGPILRITSVVFDRLLNTSWQLQSPEYDTNWASFLHLNIQWCFIIWFSYIGRNQIRLGNNVDVVQDTPPLPPLASAKVLTPPKCPLFDSNQSPTVQFSQCNKMELKRRWNLSRHCQNALKLILMSQLLYTVQHLSLLYILCTVLYRTFLLCWVKQHKLERPKWEFRVTERHLESCTEAFPEITTGKVVFRCPSLLNGNSVTRAQQLCYPWPKTIWEIAILRPFLISKYNGFGSWAWFC